MFRKLFLSAAFLVSTLSARAQKSLDEQAAETLRSHGKLSVVIAILIVIFAGIIFFLIAQELRLRRLEKKNKEQ